MTKKETRKISTNINIFSDIEVAEISWIELLEDGIRLLGTGIIILQNITRQCHDKKEQDRDSTHARPQQKPRQRCALLIAFEIVQALENSSEHEIDHFEHNGWHVLKKQYVIPVINEK